MGLESRVKKLETVLGDGGPCGTCGFDGDWSSVEVVTEVSLITERGDSREEAGPRRCPECGFPHVIKVLGEGLDLLRGRG